VQSAADRLQTNDQVLSLTDQMNLGVRLVELDTHWVKVPMVDLLKSDVLKSSMSASAHPVI
jgi:hypothetical protein